jgi:enamine deaminase RidA (YjgF/YER057c/UK114 family)
MIVRRHSNARMSQVVEYPLSGTMVALAGQVADDPTGTIEAQTASVLARIDGFLAEAGTDKTAVTHVNVWLRDIGDFAAMTQIYDGWVAAGHQPARACVEAKLADPRLKVEIQVFAVKA